MLTVVCAVMAIFSLVGQGEVAITQKASPTSPSVEVMKCGTGAYFGEIALLTNQPRKATVKSRGAGVDGEGRAYLELLKHCTAEAD